MKKRKIIALRNLPMRRPVAETAVAYLYLREFHAPDWAWGVVMTLFALVWILAFYDSHNREEIDLTKQSVDDFKKS